MKNQLSELIRKRRAQFGESLQQIAEEAGISKAHLWHLERGTANNPSIQTLVGLDMALDLMRGTCALAACGCILPGEITKLCKSDADPSQIRAMI